MVALPPVQCAFYRKNGSLVKLGLSLGYSRPFRDLVGRVQDAERIGGGMGTREHNVYARLVARLGHDDAVGRVQDHYLTGRRSEAVAAVPDALVDELARVGPPARIADRLPAWRAAGVDLVTLKTDDLALLDRLVPSG
jgi:hypothetical protein